MSLQTALSGLNSAQTGLNTVSNDLANASTTAFKSQTALFEDVYPTGETNVPGYGAQTEGMSTDLSEGDLTATGNPLDAAIQGNGYFVVSQNGTQQYTRDGAFQLSTGGQLETLTGSPVLGYVTNASGGTSGVLGPLTINTGAMAAKATGNIGLTLNLNSGDTSPAVAFSPNNSASYDESTSVVAYDSLGNANRAQLYFVQVPAATAGATPSWDVYAQTQNADGTAIPSVTPVTNVGGGTVSVQSVNAADMPADDAPFTLAYNGTSWTAMDTETGTNYPVTGTGPMSFAGITFSYSGGTPVAGDSFTINPSPSTLLTTLGFNSSGGLTGGSPANMTVNWGDGAAPSTLAFNFTGTTLAAQNFAVASTTNDGYAPGSYSGTTISSDGSITSTYSNGQTLSAGKLAIANFINPEGLESVSGNLYGATQTSGQPLVNTPGAGLAGTISGGSLEASNASTSSLLVSLIQYQQAYQANTSVLQTEQQDSQRLVQI